MKLLIGWWSLCGLLVLLLFCKWNLLYLKIDCRIFSHFWHTRECWILVSFLVNSVNDLLLQNSHSFIPVSIQMNPLFKEKLSVELVIFFQSCSLSLWLFIEKFLGKVGQHSVTPIPLLFFPKSCIIMFWPYVSFKICLIVSEVTSMLPD